MTKNLSNKILDIAVLLEENDVKEMSLLLKKIYTELEEEKLIMNKQKLVELVKLIPDKGDYDFFVTKDHFNNRFNLWLMFDSVGFTGSLNNHQFELNIVKFNKKGYVVEGLRAEEIRRFAKALYIYFAKVQTISDDRKDMVSVIKDATEICKVESHDYIDEIKSYGKVPKFYIHSEIKSLPDFSKFCLDEFSDYETFAEVLDAAYDNRYIGSQFKILR